MSDHTYDDPTKLLPKAVSCMSCNIRTNISFDSELSYNGVHYVVGTGFEDSKQAKRAAQVHVDEIKAAFAVFAANYITKQGWPKVKA